MQFDNPLAAELFILFPYIRLLERIHECPFFTVTSHSLPSPLIGLLLSFSISCFSSARLDCLVA